MRTLLKSTVLIFPAVTCLAAACERPGTPTQTRPPAVAFDFFNGNSGGRFLFGGTAQLALDPENPANDVILINTTAGFNPMTGAFAFGTVSRTLNVKIQQLDNMVEHKAFFVFPKTCFGGSPRIQLAIDLDGNGQSNGNAFGNFGPGPFGTGCPPGGIWHFEDLTDLAPRWDVTQLIGPGEIPLPGNVNPFLVPWPLLEMLIANFPNHLVCTGALVDDTFLPPGPNMMSGIAYYDLLSLGRATWVDRSDIGGRGFAMGCGRPDHGDDRHDGDHDDDHDRDDDDDRFDRDRREHKSRR
jgi:hypothetical protein